MRLRVHQDRGVEEDGEGQVEVELEEGEVKERRSWMACGWDEVRLKNILSHEVHVTQHHKKDGRLRALRAVLTGAACACRCPCTYAC